MTEKTEPRTVTVKSSRYQPTNAELNADMSISMTPEEWVKAVVRGGYPRREPEDGQRPGSCLPFCYSGFPSLSDSSLYYTNFLLGCPVRLDAVNQSMDEVLSRR